MLIHFVPHQSKLVISMCCVYCTLHCEEITIQFILLTIMYSRNFIQSGSNQEPLKEINCIFTFNWQYPKEVLLSNQHSRGEDFSLAWYKNMPTFKVSHFARSIFVYEYFPPFEIEITIVFLPCLSSIQMHLMMT